jgi:hypothetical protein
MECPKRTEALKKAQKKYVETHKEVHKRIMKNYYQNNKNKISEKYDSDKAKKKYEMKNLEDLILKSLRYLFK